MLFPHVFAPGLPAGSRKAKRKSQRRNPLPYLILVIVCLALGMLLGNMLIEAFPPGELDAGLYFLGLLLLLPGLLLVVLLSVALHEAGHVIGGWLVGSRFLLYVVGPLKIVRKGDRISVGLNRHLPLFGGFAASVPVDDRDMRRRVALSVAAGPVANLLLGFIALGIPLIAGPGLAEGSLLRVFLRVFGFISLMIGLMAAIPRRSAGFNSDGARVLSLIRGGQEAERWMAAFTITAASMGGIRPREWRPAWLEMGLRKPDGSSDDISAHLFAYYHHLDCGDPLQAGNHLDYVLSHIDEYPAAFRPALFLEAAYFTAWRRKDAAAARRYLEQGQGGFTLGKENLLRAESAVLFAEGQPAAASQAARQGLQELERSVDRGSAQAEAQWFQAILQAAEEMH